MAEQKFKIGDRVRAIGTELLYEHNLGKTGVVRYIDGGGDVQVRFDDGRRDWGFPSDLELITPATPSELTINGRRYVLAEDTAPQLEPKRKPKRGEAWWDAGGNLCLLIAGNQNLRLVQRSRI